MSRPGRKNRFNSKLLLVVVSFKDERDEGCDVKLELTCRGYRQRLDQDSNYLYYLETLHRYKQEVVKKAKGVQLHVGFQMKIPEMCHCPWKRG